MLQLTLSSDIFAQRRQALLSAMEQDGVALIPAAPSVPRNRDVHHPHRQDSDFQYLTGFPEPEAVAVLLTGEDKPYHLFCRPRDLAMETWHGRRAGVEGARVHYGADAACPISTFAQQLPELLSNRRHVYYPVGYHPAFDRCVMRALNTVRGKARAGVRAPTTFTDLGQLVHPMRWRKTPEEVSILREAARISSLAHRRAMRAARPGRGEWDLVAEIAHTFAAHGATWAYPTIVGSGDNGCILHYTENNAALQDGDLVLIDAGAEVQGYAGDITRTFPVNGRFTTPQRQLYELVLSAQLAAIAAVQPGQSVDAPHDAAVRVLTQGLVDAGILQGDVDALISATEYKRFYMHRTGHWLGMDVHDVGDYATAAGSTVFAPGMVTTIEPGLYIPTGATTPDPEWANVGLVVMVDVDHQWQRIGIRIEDDVLVTAHGHEVLTTDAPKTTNDIEEWMYGR